MNLPLRLAWRYVSQPKSRQLVQLISGISMFVIATVTAAMIAILSAFNGIEGVVNDLFGTLDAEVAILPATGSVLPGDLGATIGEVEGVAKWAPVLEDEAVVQFGSGQPVVVSVIAADSGFADITGIDDAIQIGERKDRSNGYDCTALGLGVRNLIGVRMRTEEHAMVTFRAPIRGKRLSSRDHFKSLPALVTASFSINADLDSRYALISLEAGRVLFQRPEKVNRYEVATLEDYDPEDVAFALADRLGPSVRVRTRAEKNRLITQTNRAEKWATFLILSFILIVAAFNVMASLTMLLIDKEADVAVLHSMGLGSHLLERVFSLQGLLINCIGGLAGAAVGIAVVLGQDRYGWLELEGSVIPTYPVELQWTDIVGTLAVVVFVGGIGSAAMVRYLVRRMMRQSLA